MYVTPLYILFHIEGSQCTVLRMYTSHNIIHITIKFITVCFFFFKLRINPSFPHRKKVHLYSNPPLTNLIFIDIAGPFISYPFQKGRFVFIRFFLHYLYIIIMFGYWLYWIFWATWHTICLGLNDLNFVSVLDLNTLGMIGHTGSRRLQNQNLFLQCSRNSIWLFTRSMQ